MKNSFVATILPTIFFIVFLCACQQENESPNGRQSTIDLVNCFTNPPEEARPWVYWYWMRANVTREGITRDLEAMAETGVGGAYLMTIGQANENTLVDTPANSLSEDWWTLVIHATKEAERLGLRLAMNACDGWSLAGGPWITPELSMQEVVTTTTRFFRFVLDRPRTLLPSGRWAIQRIGYTTTRVENSPAGTAAGWESDKFNSEAARTQFEGWFGKALDRIGPVMLRETQRVERIKII